MEEKILRKLEYYKIIERLSSQCASQLGKEIVGSLLPSTNLAEVLVRQAETTEAKEILRLFPSFSLGGIRDIRGGIKKAIIGGIMEPQEFLYLSDTLYAAQRVKGFFQVEGTKYVRLYSYSERLHVLKNLEQRIRKTITIDGEVSDKASEELARIRRQLRGLQGKVKEKLESLVRSTEMQKYLQDPIITIRNDRYVIPVKQEARQFVPGLVHDQSGSGATLFIEPMAVVELNNETQRLEAMERTEVVRILRHLTGQVAENREELEETVGALALLDYSFAKGKLSADMDGGPPVINDKGRINIIQGRHPLIQGSVVPISISLGQDFNTLVITGPNTGGKTVTLKTVGLFTIMAQAGLHVPAQGETELAIFQKVFVDIGDEQSIEQSLSTFSSHMTNIIDLLDKVDGNTLVLMDELGAGTDPTEGAALAMAILEFLIQRRAKTIATTHYSELKSFAYNNEEVENASVEFDVETLRPTYRLLIGVPGKSNAFEISRRLGLSESLVERARSYLSQEEARVADLIENLETNQMLSERDRREAEKLKESAHSKLIQLEKREVELKGRFDELIRKAHSEALEIVTRARRDSEAILKEVKEVQKKTNNQNLELQGLRDQLREKEAVLQNEVYKEEAGKGVSSEELEPGDNVLIKRLNQKAQVLEKPQGDEVLVQAGIMKITVRLKDITKVEEGLKEKKERQGIGDIVSHKARDIRTELDLRGLTVDEAVLEVEKYVDDAYLAGLSQAYIIHGKGTGALRGAITDLVKKHPHVKTHRIGGYNEGGHGVTVVEFKK